MAPPFRATYQLNRSTIILTSNASGWTDTLSAGRYGVVGYGWSNDRARWRRAGRPMGGSCEAALLEQARRVKALSPGTKVLVYRQGMYAETFLESSRAVMYKPEYAGFFLRYKSGAVYANTGAEGDAYFWNFTNASAVEYYKNVYVGGPRGTGSPLIGGILLGASAGPRPPRPGAQRTATPRCSHAPPRRAHS